ncbi:hypothetical protein [Streptomyces sp. NPDC058572]|uniref:hypothetical protein n=1 Tax=Streptomyces sp. NPDC058572 TaxID=3346546 RepID=UPI0036562576
MSKEEEFNPWKWDRDNASAGRARLTVERHGHQVSLDHRGVSIDGCRIVHDDPAKGSGPHGFEVRPDGTVMYRDTQVASISAPEGSGPGEVQVWGKNGPSARERQQQEEADRQRRDAGYRARQEQQELTREGQEIAP